MAYKPPRTRKLYPWPWGHQGIIAEAADLEEQQRLEANYWLDADLGEDSDSDDSDYVQSEGLEGDGSTSDSDEDADDISESELAYVLADAQTAWRPSSPTPSLRALEMQENLIPQIADLVKAEEAAAAAYDPDQVVDLITQFYELLITMGQYPEGSLRYAPHTDPPVDEALAVQLGYDPAAISLMLRLPYLVAAVNHNDDDHAILNRTSFSDYTCAHHLKEGRAPWPYDDGCTSIDPWLLPLMLPGRDGWNVILDTRLGVVRAYSIWMSPPSDIVEWRRHGEPSEWGHWTECRRAPLVTAERYFSDLIHAYRSLLRLPVINSGYNDPLEEPDSRSAAWCQIQEREEKQTVLALYHECGWPDKWRRAEFMSKWEAKKKEIDARVHEAYQASRNVVVN
ncbi:hypothetical protein DFH06DRAFT_605925 [Mycena polygramma]|nr:hypothetical protein DFH06DRAFT_605925 [Mycena polygramma]